MFCHTLQQHACGLEERIAANLRLSDVNDVVCVDILVNAVWYKLLHRVEGHSDLEIAGEVTGQHLGN